MRRRLFIISLIAALVLTAAGCGKTPASSSAAESTVPPSATETLLYRQTGDWDEPAVSSANFSFTKGEMVYLFAIIFNQSASSIRYFGGDPAVSLKTQVFTADDSGDSWFTVLMEDAIDFAEHYLMLCELSKANGYVLDAEDEAFLKDQEEAMQKEAAAYGWDKELYLQQLYGTDIRWKDLDGALRKMRLAEQYYKKQIETLTFSPEELEEEFAAHMTNFAVVDYYLINLGDGEAIPPELIDQTKEKLEAAADETALKAALEDFLLKTQPAASVEEAGGIKAFTEDYLTKNRQESQAYDDSDFMKWAFAEGRKAGDVFYQQNASTNAPYAYYLISAPRKNTGAAVDVRHILFKTGDVYATAEEARAKAEEIYKLWQDEGEKEDRFIELCAEYSADRNAQTGGLYTGVLPGQMVQTFNDWCFDEARMPGDSGLVDTQFGTHMMLFVSRSILWESQTKESLRGKEYQRRVDEQAVKTPVTIKQELIDSIAW